MTMEPKDSNQGAWFPGRNIPAIKFVFPYVEAASKDLTKGYDIKFEELGNLGKSPPRMIE